MGLTNPPEVQGVIWEEHAGEPPPEGLLYRRVPENVGEGFIPPKVKNRDLLASHGKKIWPEYGPLKGLLKEVRAPTPGGKNFGGRGKEIFVLPHVSEKGGPSKNLNRGKRR